MVEVEASLNPDKVKTIHPKCPPILLRGHVLGGKLAGNVMIVNKETQEVMFRCLNIGSDMESIMDVNSKRVWVGRHCRYTSSHPHFISSAESDKRFWGDYELTSSSIFPKHFRSPLFSAVHNKYHSIPSYVTSSTSNGGPKEVFSFRVHHKQLLKHGLHLKYPSLSNGSYRSYPSRLVSMNNNQLGRELCIWYGNNEVREYCDFNRQYIGGFAMNELYWDGKGTISVETSGRLVSEIEGEWKDDELVGGVGYDLDGDEYTSIFFSRHHGDLDNTDDVNKIDNDITPVSETDGNATSQHGISLCNVDCIGVDNRSPESIMIWGYYSSLLLLSLEAYTQSLTRLSLCCSFLQPTTVTLHDFPRLQKVVVGPMNMNNCTRFCLLNLPELKDVVFDTSCLNQCTVLVIYSKYFK